MDDDKFPWVESHRVKPDGSDEAIKRWVAEHWDVHLRTRWIEHLEGSRFWMEVDHGDFGLLQREFIGDRDLLQEVLAQLKAGRDNLGIICWAQESDFPCEPVVRILEAFDINDRRLRNFMRNDNPEPPPNPDVIIDDNDPGKKE